jgi:sortase A
MGWLRQVERWLLIVGVLLLVFFVAARMRWTVLSIAALQRCETRAHLAGAGLHALVPGSTPDLSLWSKKRVREYEESVAADFSPAIGVLRIPKINVDPSFLEGIDDLSSIRGVGYLTGTAKLGEDGNVSIGGHRDGFFRGLKDVVVGDNIGLITLTQTETYIIDRFTIGERTEVSVLQRRLRSSLTLVTCYPFHFIGSARQRYIVQAFIAGFAPASRQACVRVGSLSRRPA